MESDMCVRVCVCLYLKAKCDFKKKNVTFVY